MSGSIARFDERVSCELIAIGASWGGLNAMSAVLDGLEPEVDAPVVLAQHRDPASVRGSLVFLLQRHVERPVLEPDDKQPIEHGHVYVAPADYHLLVENGHFSLSTDARVQFARPSIDVLFESVAAAYAERAVGIVLTGANDDGARGLAAIKAAGGVAVVQEPASASRRTMPEAALAAVGDADAILPVEEIPRFLYDLCVGAPR